MAPEVPSPVVDLRPLTTSELIDRGFSLYRRNFAALLLLALLSQVAPLLVQVLTGLLHLFPAQSELAAGAGRAIGHAILFLVLVFVSQLVGFGFEVVMTFYVADSYLGKIPTLIDSFRNVRGLVIKSVWTCVLNRVFYFLALIFPTIALFAVEAWYLISPPASFMGFVVYASVTAVLLVASLAPVLIVFMRLMTTVPVLALEGLGGWAACRRSSALVRYDPGLGFFYWGETRLSLLLLPLFVIELLTYMLTSVPMILSQINDAIRHGTAAEFAAPSDAVMVGSQVLTYLAGALILPLYTIAVTLFYYDVRIRREGFDLEFLAGRLEAAR